MIKNILIVTRWFPNKAEPTKCVFTKNIVDAQAQSDRYSFAVISPIPYFPNIKISRLKKYTKFSNIPLVEKLDSYLIYRPKYVKLPHPYFKNFEWWPYFSRVLKIIKKENIKFDLIHCHGIYPDGLVGWEIGKYFNKKVILHVHDTYLDIARELDVYRRIFRSVDKLIPVSVFQMNQITKVDEGLIQKCEVIYNGVNIDKRPVTFSEPRESADKTIKLIFVGHLIRRKGLDILLDALKILDDYQFNLDVIGNGPKKLEYEKLSENYGLKDKVNFVGEISNPDLLKKLPYYDYLVLPSRYETFGIVLIEAMSCGLPVISTKVASIPEIVTSEEVGILVEPDSPESFAKGIIKAFNKKWDRGKIKKYAKNFSIEKTVEKIEQAYDELSGS